MKIGVMLEGQEESLMRKEMLKLQTEFIEADTLDRDPQLETDRGELQLVVPTIDGIATVKVKLDRSSDLLMIIIIDLSNLGIKRARSRMLNRPASLGKLLASYKLVIYDSANVKDYEITPERHQLAKAIAQYHADEDVNMTARTREVIRLVKADKELPVNIRPHDVESLTLRIIALGFSMNSINGLL